MTAQTFTQAALAMVALEARTASDAGFKLVGACSVAFIACHFEKGDAPSTKEEMLLTVGDFHKKSHASDIVNAGLRLARRIIKNKELLATIAAEQTPDAAAVLVAAEARTIAHEFGSPSLRSLFEALKPAGARKSKADDLARALKAIAKLEEFDGLTLATLDALEAEITKLRTALAAREAQEIVDALPNITGQGVEEESEAA